MLCYDMICHAMLCYAMHGYVMAIDSWASTSILYMLCMCYAMLLLQGHNLYETFCWNYYATRQILLAVRCYKS